ncbi:YqcI/YcgG family protein [Heyndrickxia camelliae]|uniref:YqcI/YcgG family protein n=1 Tax=Heyndrickxia camelliae TaxID=1707093 RepID=A0A2N3LLR3_9BACI|nr:YqcI/YcgG family protein [Heyndrickxia camelliae]PKR85479.1 hypothetical protein CWO92_07115 [Heyndrickxia camelliae]
MVKLYEKDILYAPLESWQQEAMSAFDAKITHKTLKFPCIPAYQGYILNQMKFGFASDPRDENASFELAGLLKKYGQASRNMGIYTALIVFFKTPEDLKSQYTVSDYEMLFWQLLNRVSSLDETNWVESISQDPHDPTWEFCFHHERYFVYCATPAHEKRKSRHFPTFMLAITPRWVLDEFSASISKAEKMKKMIRTRLEKYDNIPPHPDLKWYGQQDNYEWKQYYLRDDDTSLPSCPFKHAWKK